MRLTETKLIIKAPKEALKNVQLSQIEEILTGCILMVLTAFKTILRAIDENFKQIKTPTRRNNAMLKR
ncbi:hypothetical protein TW0001_15200 [Helicobacter pylori]